MKNLEQTVEKSFLGKVRNSLGRIRNSAVSKIAVYSLAGVLSAGLGYGCGPECPYASKSDLYRSCAGGDDCGCVTIDYSSTHEEHMDLKCREMRNFEGKTKKICTAHCIGTRGVDEYNLGYNHWCSLGTLSSAKCETCPGGLSFTTGLTSSIKKSVCALPSSIFDSDNWPERESIDDKDMYCIPYRGFAIEGTLEELYSIDPGY